MGEGDWFFVFATEDEFIPVFVGFKDRERARENALHSFQDGTDIVFQKRMTISNLEDGEIRFGVPQKHYGKRAFPASLRQDVDNHSRRQKQRRTR